MKAQLYFKYYALALPVICLLGACTKTVGPPMVSALNVINASPDVPSLAVSFANPPVAFYKQQAVVYYGSAMEYGNPAGNLPFALVSSADTTKGFLSGTLNLAPTKAYSFYISGSLPQLDTLLLQDNIPVRMDSTAGIRVINLSPNSGPVALNLVGGSSDFSGIAYRKISPFKSYPVTTAIINNGGYNFEARNNAGTPIATFNLNNGLFPFRNFTLVVCGNVSSGYQIFQVNNF